MAVLEMHHTSSRPSADQRFRKDIEGMRGLAVLLVLLYHCTIALPGGYVGVDVFFVISGYLITRLLLSELEQGTFSARNFYVRRVRRLIPALLATIVLTLVAGLVILSPYHLAEVAMSSVFAALSLSNVHFMSSGGYFDTSSTIKPLLHTWSLSVEEQYYLVWPLALLVAFRVRFLRKHLFTLMAIGALAGILLSQYWIGRNPAQAYFLLPFRAHQLLIGGLAVGFERRVKWIPPLAAAAIFIAGLVVLIASAAVFDRETPFPGFASVVPASGGLAMIIAAPFAVSARRLMELPLLTWLGARSYSIYLAHWPLISYTYYLSGDTLSPVLKWVLLLLSIAGGASLHGAVEKRYRLAGIGHGWREAMPVAVAGVATILVSGTFLSLHGLPQRMDLVPDKRDLAEAMKFQFLRDHGDGVLTIGPAAASRTVLIMGDSMVQNYAPAILSLAQMQSARTTMVTRGGCVVGWGTVKIVRGGVDKECRSLRDRIFEGDTHFDLVVWSQNWNGYSGELYMESAGPPTPVPGDGIERWEEIVSQTLAHLKARVSKIVLIGPQLTVKDVPVQLSRIGPVSDTATIEPLLARMTETDAEEREAALTGLQHMVGWVSVIDPKTIVCPTGTCRFHDGNIGFFLDAAHYTAAFTPFLAAQLEKQLVPLLGW